MFPQQSIAGRERKGRLLSITRNAWTGWTKSHWSGVDACVEARRDADFVEVRHSNHPQGPVLQFTAREWNAFLKGVRDGEFDLP